MDWNHIMPLLQSLKTELADLESVVTSTTCTEFGDFEREFEAFDPDSMTPFYTQNSQSHTE